MDEEHKILGSVIREFTQKEIQPIAKQIETSEIPKELKAKLSAQGFLGALAPSDLGGSELDRLGYSLLLEEIASESPSVAFYILIQNSLVIRSLIGSDAGKDLVAAVSRGESSGTLYYSDLLNLSSPGSLEFRNGKIEGTIQGVINAKSDIYIVRTSDAKVYAVTEGFETMPRNEMLGMRGLSLSPVKFSSDAGKALGLNVNINEILEGANLPISAIALGISRGALIKAMDYSRERSAFLHKLKDYQPLAFGMSQAYSQLEVLKSYFMGVSQSGPDVKKELMIKLLTVDFAREVSKLALQVHGGYGYLMDFGIEKYYRDAMFLSTVGGNNIEDRKKLSSLVFETDAGSI